MKNCGRHSLFARLIVSIAILGCVSVSQLLAGAPNLLVNPGFESGSDGWFTPSSGPFLTASGVTFEGERAMQATVDTQLASEFAQSVSVVPGENYVISGQVRTSKLDVGTAALWVDWLSANGSLLGSNQVGELRGTHTWKMLFDSLTAPMQARKAQIILRCEPDATGVGSSWFDSVEFRGAAVQSNFAGLSAYLGGNDEDTIRDAFLDAAGNIYLAGGTASADFPVTAGAYDTQFNPGGANPHDAWVTKMRSDGSIIWSTFIGGPNYDRAYAIEVDDLGYVYVAGRAGAGFPTTPGVLQPSFAGDVNPNDLYGQQDGFVAKLTPDGRQLVWSTYFGGADRSFIRDFDIDSLGQVHLALTQVTVPVPHITPGAFQVNLQGMEDGVVAKLSADGTRAIWATYLGGSGFDMGTPSIRVDFFGHVYVLGTTDSPNFPTTGGAFDRTFNGHLDMHLVKISAAGNQLLFGTYFGGSDVEFSETHGLALDPQGSAYVAATTRSMDLPTTPGAFQRIFGGIGGPGQGAGTNYPGDGFIAKFSATSGQLVAATYLGGSDGEGLEGVGVAEDGTVFVGGSTFSNDFPVSADAAQPGNHGSADLIAVKLSSDLRTMLYGTYFGGSGTDFGRSEALDASGNTIVVGHSQSHDFPVMIGFPNQDRGGGDGVFAEISLSGFCAIAGTSCDDDNACTINDVCNGQGGCVGQPIPLCESCASSNECDDGIACTSNNCAAGKCVYVASCSDDGNPCNGTEVCDVGSGSCVSQGNPCPGVCDPQTGCPCQAPVLEAAGGRYLAMDLLPGNSTVPTDITLTSTTLDCLTKYAAAPTPIDVDADGVADGGLVELVDDPSLRAVLTPAQWGGRVFITDDQIIPSDKVNGVTMSTVYTAAVDCGVFQSEATVTMPLWGDTNLDGFVNVLDIQTVVFAFQDFFNPLTAASLASTDLSGGNVCATDHGVSVVDVQRAVLAFQGQSYRQAAAYYPATCGLCP